MLAVGLFLISIGSIGRRLTRIAKA
jgi:hypothetical protein